MRRLGLCIYFGFILGLCYAALETTRPEPENAKMEELGAIEAVQSDEPTQILAVPVHKVTGQLIIKAEIESPWTDDDREMIAKMVMAEAEAEPLEGKCLVANVIINRVMSDSFPNDVKSVLCQKKQFSSWTNGRYEKAVPNDEVWQAVQMVLDEDQDDSEGALFFEATYLTDTWQSKNRTYLFTVGHHKFYQ